MLSVLSFESVFACKCLGNIESGFKTADQVLLARVVSAQAHPGYFEIKIDLLEVLKGAASKESIIVTGESQLFCGLGHISVGLNYVLFIDEVELKNTKRQSVASCQSFAIADIQSRKSLETLQAWGQPQDLAAEPRPECKRLSKLIVALRQLRKNYTDVHPDIVSVQQSIGDINTSLRAVNPGKSLQEICPTISSDKSE